MKIDYNLAVTPMLTLAGSVEARQLASESALLRVGARRSGVSSSVNVALSQTEYARFGLSMVRYTSLSGAVLGSGGLWNAEAGSHLRLAYPNLTVRLYAAGTAYRDRGQADAAIINLLTAGIDPATYRVLPQNDTLVGFSIGAGTVAESVYSRGWRPFAEAGATYSRTVGSGYNLRAGVVGSLLGQDLIHLRGLRASGSAAAPQGLQEFGIDYNWFF